MVMALMFITGVGLVVTALLSYSAGALNSAAFTGQAAQSSAEVGAAMETAINDVRNGVYTNDGTSTPCIASGNVRTYPALTTAGVATTVTCAPVAESGLGGGTSVPISPANRPPSAVLITGTYTGGAMPGTLPPDPTGVTVAPTSGLQGTAVIVSGANIAGATAILVGTAAEIQTATATTLSPCPGGVAAIGCFTTSGTTLGISSMPAHASGAVQVKVITLGTASSGAFTYQSVPAAPAAPVATAGAGSATVVWSAPADGGSPITGYVVTPTRNGVVQTAVNVPAAPTSSTLTGLTVGATYTFRVAAGNAVGTGPASTPSNAVVPFTNLPGAPTIGTATAGTLAATVRWTAPLSDGGSPLTGYVVTPYLGAVAQPAQTFASTATTQRVTGLTAGASYTFRVSARNAGGIGPQSAASNAVTINAVMTLTFPNPLPAGIVGDFYFTALTSAGGTSPFVWSISVGSLPAGLTLVSTNGWIYGTPTATDNDNFTVRVTDADGVVVTRVTRIRVTNNSPQGVQSSSPPVRIMDADPEQRTEMQPEQLLAAYRDNQRRRIGRPSRGRPCR